jgi:hypothetical protein
MIVSFYNLLHYNRRHRYNPTMSGLSASASGAAAYDPATSTATLEASQATDVSACLITLPVSLLVSVADVEIYGTAMTSAAPMVDCSGLLPVSALFDANPSKSAVNFVQDPSDPNGVVASVPAEFNDTLAGNFARGFNSSLLKKPVKLTSLDANAYLWWNDTGKSISSDPNFANPNSVLYKYANFPQFVVAKVAYDVFGHPMAQAGIANDTEITGQLAGTAVGSTSLGVRLAAAFKTLTEGQLQAVYEQMLQQDPARFKLEDASGGALGSDGQSATSLPRSLPFKAGDKIRFEVILDDYDVKRVALNAIAGNSNTSKSGSTLTSEIAASNAQAGQVLTTRYAGMRVTVQMGLGTTAGDEAAIVTSQSDISNKKIEAGIDAANAAAMSGGDEVAQEAARVAKAAEIQAAADAAFDAAVAEGKSDVEAWAAAAAAAIAVV